MRVAAGDKADAVLILSSGTFFMGCFIRMGVIRKHRLPSMGSLPYRDAGAMLCYGANFVDMFARAADFVDRIFKGQEPANLPIEQPTKFELIVNATTARSLDIIIPHTLLLRADEVIN